MAMQTILCDPQYVYEYYESRWFDTAHQHTLLYNDSYFYILTHIENTHIINNLSKGEENQTYNKSLLFYHYEKNGDEILNAKVSLDNLLLAVQNKHNSITVCDVSSQRQWTVEIKSPNENLILPNGIIWSEHGGNSQDLLIATTRGLEIYKISQVRGQCKLSRFLPLPAFNIWYEPNHRFILLASIQKFDKSNQQFNIRSEIFLMDGCFLRVERSSMPILELPPPERMSRFQLGPNITCEDVSLVSIYGKLSCLVHFVDENRMSYINIYFIGKSLVQRAVTLSLNRMTLSSLQFSIFDNLIIVHCEDNKCSFIFDVLSSPRKLYTASYKHTPIDSIVQSNQAVLVDPVGPSTLVYYSDAAYEKYILPEIESHNQSSENIPQEKAPLIHSASDHTIHDFNRLTFHWQNKFIINNTDNGEVKNSTNMKGSILIDIYAMTSFHFIAPNWVWDIKKKSLWKLVVNFTNVSKSIRDRKELNLFLCRRGITYRQYRLPQMIEPIATNPNLRQETNFTSVPTTITVRPSPLNSIACIAKQQLLIELYDALILRVGLSWLRELFRSIMTPYAVESLRIASMESNKYESDFDDPPLNSADSIERESFLIPYRDSILSSSNSLVIPSSVIRDAEARSTSVFEKRRNWKFSTGNEEDGIGYNSWRSSGKVSTTGEGSGTSMPPGGTESKKATFRINANQSKPSSGVLTAISKVNRSAFGRPAPLLSALSDLARRATTSLSSSSPSSLQSTSISSSSGTNSSMPSISSAELDVISAVDDSNPLEVFNSFQKFQADIASAGLVSESIMYQKRRSSRKDAKAISRSADEHALESEVDFLPVNTIESLGPSETIDIQDVPSQPITTELNESTPIKIDHSGFKYESNSADAASQSNEYFTSSSLNQEPSTNFDEEDDNIVQRNTSTSKNNLALLRSLTQDFDADNEKGIDYTLPPPPAKLNKLMTPTNNRRKLAANNPILQSPTINILKLPISSIRSDIKQSQDISKLSFALSTSTIVTEQLTRSSSGGGMENPSSIGELSRIDESLGKAVTIRQLVKNPSEDTLHNLAHDSFKNRNHASEFTTSFYLNTSGTLPITLRRDTNENLIVTQSEILAHIWLPLILSLDCVKCNSPMQETSMASKVRKLDYYISAIATYVSVLQECKIIPSVSMCILLMTLLFSKKEYNLLASYLRHEFFPDCIDIALKALEFADAMVNLIEMENIVQIDNSNDETSETSNGFNYYIAQQSAAINIQQSGLDMLLRIGERGIVLRWYLCHGCFTDAITVVGSPRSAMGRQFLDSISDSVSAIDFFHGCVYTLQNMVELEYGNDYDIPVKQVEDQISILDSKRKDYMYLLYQFLKEWNYSLLIPNKETKKPSYLASQTNFPDKLFDVASARKFKELFGFTVD